MQVRCIPQLDAGGLGYRFAQSHFSFSQQSLPDCATAALSTLTPHLQLLCRGRLRFLGRRGRQRSGIGLQRRARGGRLEQARLLLQWRRLLRVLHVTFSL